MPEMIDLNKQEKPKRKRPDAVMMLELSREEEDMLLDLARAYGIMWRGQPNKNGMAKYLIRSAFGMLTRGEKL